MDICPSVVNRHFDVCKEDLQEQTKPRVGGGRVEFYESHANWWHPWTDGRQLVGRAPLAVYSLTPLPLLAQSPRGQPAKSGLCSALSQPAIEATSPPSISQPPNQGLLIQRLLSSSPTFPLDYPLTTHIFLSLPNTERQTHLVPDTNLDRHRLSFELYHDPIVRSPESESSRSSRVRHRCPWVPASPKKHPPSRATPVRCDSP